MGGQSWRTGIKCHCKRDWLWVRAALEGVKYLFKFTFPFLRFGVEAKRGVELRHSARNISRTRQTVGNRVFYHQVPSDYSAVYGKQREVDYIDYRCCFLHTSRNWRSELSSTEFKRTDINRIISNKDLTLICRYHSVNKYIVF